MVERLPLGVRVSFCTHDDRVLVLNAKASLDDPTFSAATADWPKVPEAPAGRPMSVTAAALGGALAASIGALTLVFSLVFLIAPAWDLFALFLALGVLPSGVGLALLGWARSRWRAHEA